MEMQHIVTFETPIDAGLHDLLTGQGAWPDTDPWSWRTPSVEVFAALVAKLNDRGISFETFIEFLPSQGEDLERLAAYVGLDDFTEVRATASDLVMASDERTFATVVSARMRQHLSTMTTGLTFDPLAQHDGFFVITEAVQLPEPIILPRTIFLSEGTDGVWAVQSDGRELLTEANLQTVRESGMVYAPRCETNGQVLRWRRPPIFSGPVLAQFRDMDIQGIIDPPAFLGHAAEKDRQG
jgi:hypothetical protein